MSPFASRSSGARKSSPRTFDDENMLVVILGCSVAAGLAATLGGVGAGDDLVVVGCEDRGGRIAGPARGTPDGLVKASRRLSRSPIVGLSGCSSSTCSIFLLIAGADEVIRVVGSTGFGIDAARCSSIRLRGALAIVVAVGFCLRAISRGLMIPVGFLGA